MSERERIEGELGEVDDAANDPQDRNPRRKNFAELHGRKQQPSSRQPRRGPTPEGRDTPPPAGGEEPPPLPPREEWSPPPPPGVGHEP